MTKINSILEDLEARGLISQTTPNLAEDLGNITTIYVGFDPTATSLHLGNLFPIVQLLRFNQRGYRAIALVGEATASIGDPSGKNLERDLIEKEKIGENAVSIREQLKSLGVKSIISNARWFSNFPLVEFLREIGKNFSVNVMLQKESVRRRLESEDGISYTEFTYSLMQAYDFLELFDRYNCTLQIGGSDQWGNITAGIDLIRRKRGSKAHGMTFPLLTTSSGQKFGKTEIGTIWLDPKMTTPYQFYQYLLNVSDKDVIFLLKALTFLSPSRIAEIEAIHNSHSKNTKAQTILAAEVTKFVHSPERLSSVQEASHLLFSGYVHSLTENNCELIYREVPKNIPLKRLLLETKGVNLLDLLMLASEFGSRTEAKKAISSGSIRLNGDQILSSDFSIKDDILLFKKFLLIQIGKKRHIMVKDVNSPN